ncbi:hypothetical protein CEXT_614441 [Caerostris extrusa]|uniref:Uncharacterized protein n=1 Tax=Caerostris extrusa TaxID=172846 RepID=A0AAV4TBD8_CAEEX|nr:hypothetical protein CEXT_614441 [Caerostris extrusa]
MDEMFLDRSNPDDSLHSVNGYDYNLDDGGRSSSVSQGCNVCGWDGIGYWVFFPSFLNGRGNCVAQSHSCHKCNGVEDNGNVQSMCP